MRCCVRVGCLAGWLVGCTHAPAHPHDGAHAANESSTHVHHGHAHHFADAESWARRFEEPGRDEWQRPEVVIEALALTETSVVADIGAATGYFPVRMAARVPRGRVWGVDIEPAMVRYLNDRARREGHGNLFAVLGTATDPLLPEPVDALLIVNTYHHIADRKAYFEAVAHHLRPGARIVVVDFKMGDLPVGPPDAMKVPVDVIEQEMGAAGYRVRERDSEALRYQHVLVFEHEGGR